MCREFTLLCRRLGPFGGELLAIDGSKFRAVNARDRSYTPATLARLQREIDQQIAALRERQAQYTALGQQLAPSGATALSLTDPDSRPMVSRGRIEVCYNVQTAVDAKHKLIVAQEVLGGATPVVVADRGYYYPDRTRRRMRRAGCS